MALVTAALSGCAPVAPGIDSAAASKMQASVSAVTQAAAANDPSRAIAGLDTLEAQLKQDTASGAINADRSARIQASIDLVRADLTAALPTPSPTPTVQTPSQQENKGKDGNDKKGKDG
ncbi:MAG: hypothetical protein ABI275_01750 [Terrimesophilobacter sp.]